MRSTDESSLHLKGITIITHMHICKHNIIYTWFNGYLTFAPWCINVRVVCCHVNCQAQMLQLQVVAEAFPSQCAVSVCAGQQSSHSSSVSRHYLMPGYTGHVPGITTMEPGLSYLERTGQFLDRADHRDRIHHVVPGPADSQPAIAMVKAALAKHSRKQRHSKSHRHAQKEAKTTAAHKSIDVATSKSQKSAPPSASSKVPSRKNSSQPAAPVAGAGSARTVKSPQANPHQTSPGSLAMHVSPTPGYTGHIPRQFDLNPGMTFGKQTSFLQTGTWNSEESCASPQSSSSQQKPSGYTGHLPGAIHLAPGLSYSKVSKVVQRQMSPTKGGSRSSTSESVRQKSLDTARSANFYHSVPAGYSGHIPGIVHLEPGKNYLRQAAEFMEASSNPSPHTVTVLSSPSHTTHIPCTQFPSGYSGHIPGARLLEPGLSYATQTKIVESRLHEAAGHPSRERAASRPSSKAYPQMSTPLSQVGKREAQSEKGSKVGSKASTRGHTPASATHK